MIQLFNLPSCEIKLHSGSNFLHGQRVIEFEEDFARHVGAKYACSFNSASSAIFLALRMLIDRWPHIINSKKRLYIPSTIPPVVPNMVIQAGIGIRFVDNASWIGHNYTLINCGEFKIVDSAQAADRDIFKRDADPQDMMVFSFYPTKPVGSIDGGMIVSNDKSKIEYLRKMSMNGTSQSINSWERSLDQIGWKMYMNSVQAQVAQNSLRTMGHRIRQLNLLRTTYNNRLLKIHKPQTKGQNGYHLYRIYVHDNTHFIDSAKDNGIICGLHYLALHSHPLYGKYVTSIDESFPESNMTQAHSVSIPFHTDLSDKDIDKIISFTLDYQDKYEYRPHQSKP